MPNPGFYHQVWEDGVVRMGQTYRRLLAQVAKVLRERGQPISAADLIAAETTARGLAALRGHALGLASRPGRRHRGRPGQGRVQPGTIASAARRRPRGLPRRRTRAAGRRDRSAAARSRPEAAGSPTTAGRPTHALARSSSTSTSATDREQSRSAPSDRPAGDRWLRADGRDRLRPSRRPVEVLGALADLLVAGSGCVGDRGGAVRSDARRGGRRPAARSGRRESSAMPRRPPGSCSTPSSPGSTRWPASCKISLPSLIRQDGDFLAVTGALGHLLYLYRHDATSAAADAATSPRCWPRRSARALAAGRTGAGRRPGREADREHPRPARDLRALRRGRSTSIARNSSTC